MTCESFAPWFVVFSTQTGRKFDLAAAPLDQPGHLAALETGAWIEAREPVVLLGDSGTEESRRERA